MSLDLKMKKLVLPMIAFKEFTNEPLFIQKKDDRSFAEHYVKRQVNYPKEKTDDLMTQTTDAR